MPIWMRISCSFVNILLRFVDIYVVCFVSSCCLQCLLFPQFFFSLMLLHLAAYSWMGYLVSSFVVALPYLNFLEKLHICFIHTFSNIAYSVFSVYFLLLLILQLPFQFYGA